jgi:hypothetical protein
MKLKKGSAAAKAYMAKIRAKRGKPKKVGKTGTTKAKKGINVKIVKRPGSTAHVKTTKTTLRENLKSEGLKLPHGYSIAKRINGVNTSLNLTPSGYGHFKVSMQYYGKTISCITSNMPAVDDYQSEDGDRRKLKGFKTLKSEVIRKNKF